MNYRIFIAAAKLSWSLGGWQRETQQLGPLEKCQVFMVVLYNVHTHLTSKWWGRGGGWGGGGIPNNLMAVLINEFSEGQKPF